MRYGKKRWVGSSDAANEAKIEYLVVSFDDEKKEVKLSLRQAEILEALAKDEELLKQGGGVPDIAQGVVKCVAIFPVLDVGSICADVMI